MPSSRLPIYAWPLARGQEHHPYTTELYRHLQATGVEAEEFRPLRALFLRRPILHVHWPEAYINGTTSNSGSALRMATQVLLLLACRSTRCRIVWTAHNAGSHDRLHPRVEAIFWFFFARLLSAVIAPSRGSKDAVLRQHPKLRVPIVVIPLGRYDSRPAGADLRPYLHAEDISAPGAICFFGAQRRYKNISTLVQAFSGAETVKSELQLLVAGDPVDREVVAELSAMCENQAGIIYDPRLIPDEELPDMLSRCRIAVLPYREVLNSGSALLLLDHKVPVVLPRSATFTELQDNVGADWVYLYDGELTSPVLESAVRWRAGLTASAPDLSAYEWAAVAGSTAALLRAVAANDYR